MNNKGSYDWTNVDYYDPTLAQLVSLPIRFRITWAAFENKSVLITYFYGQSPVGFHKLEPGGKANVNFSYGETNVSGDVEFRGKTQPIELGEELAYDLVFDYQSTLHKVKGVLATWGQ